MNYTAFETAGIVHIEEACHSWLLISLRPLEQNSPAVRMHVQFLLSRSSASGVIFASEVCPLTIVYQVLLVEKAFRGHRRRFVAWDASDIA